MPKKTTEIRKKTPKLTAVTTDQLMPDQYDNLDDALGIIHFMQQTLCSGQDITLDKFSQEGVRCLLQQLNTLVHDTIDLGI